MHGRIIIMILTAVALLSRPHGTTVDRLGSLFAADALHPTFYEGKDEVIERLSFDPGGI